MKRNLGELEHIIGYQFQDKSLLECAMRHRSYTNEHHMEKEKSNERLEFLGDAVLELISSEYLFYADQSMLEGQLTRLRAGLVCEPSLADCARQIELGTFLRLGKGEDSSGGRKRESLISDALEALLGAVYVDGGFANAKEFVLNYILKDIQDKQIFYDSKTILQEMVQGNIEGSISYRLIREEGPDHNKEFVTEVFIGDISYGMGKGKSKKVSEQHAAYHAIIKLRQGKIG